MGPQSERFTAAEKIDPQQCSTVAGRWVAGFHRHIAESDEQVAV